MLVRSEAEKLFHNEVREKKRTASGVHSKTGKNGYVGKMRFPSDIMSRKEKMAYRRAGKVMTTNLFDEIMHIDDFEALEAHEQKNRLQYWRTNNSIKDIQSKMGISHKKYYDIIERLDLPKGSRGGSTRSAKVKAPAKKKEAAPTASESLPAAPEKEEAAPVQEIIVNGLHLVFQGTFSPEQITKQLSKFELLLDGETDDFYVELKLMQKQPQKA